MSIPNLSKYEGLQLRRLNHGGFLVCHPDIYNLGSLYFAATTIDEAFEFIRRELMATDDEQAATDGKAESK